MVKLFVIHVSRNVYETFYYDTGEKMDFVPSNVKDIIWGGLKQ